MFLLEWRDNERMKSRSSFIVSFPANCWTDITFQCAVSDSDIIICCLLPDNSWGHWALL